jgi:hypothetical protein
MTYIYDAYHQSMYIEVDDCCEFSKMHKAVVVVVVVVVVVEEEVEYFVEYFSRILSRVLQ